MKYLLSTLGIIVVAAMATGAVFYRVSSEPALHAAASKGDAMGWLRADFHLSDAQFEAIRRLHDGYSGTCAEHCRRIQEANRKTKALLAAGADPAAVAAANRELQELRTTCETAITRHVRQVAAMMSPGDGQRYLALVLPKISNFDHQAAPDLQLNRTP